MSAALRLSLPPDWWTLPVEGGAVAAALIDTHLHRQLPGAEHAALRAQLLPEWVVMTRAAAALGARLVAGGATRDGLGGGARLVCAMLTLVQRPSPARRTAELPAAAEGIARSAEAAGAVADVVDLPAGPAARTVRLDEAPLPDGDVLLLLCTDVVLPTRHLGTWTLAFTTPALEHAELLGEVFATVAATVELADVPSPVG